MKFLRWALFLPLGFIASVICGYFANLITEVMGGASWYVWLISGAVSGGAFIVVSIKVAPEENKTSKWLTFGTVSILGALSSLGAIMAGKQLVSALAGLAMIAMAVFVIQPFHKSNKNIS